MNRMTCVEILRPIEKTHALLYDIGIIIGGSLFVAICAQLSVHLPFNPVPITGQTLAVLLIGALFGSVRGSLAMVAYLTEGSVGIPVFAGGSSGLAHIFGPTGGYLLGFVLAAFVVGKLAERGWDRQLLSVIPAMVLGTLTIYIVGLSWLVKFVGPANVFTLGLYPFIPGALLKISLASILLPVGWKLYRPNHKHKDQTEY